MPKEDKRMPELPDITLTPDQLMDRVSALSDSERSYALWWLASCGSEHLDGQALLRALEAVKRHNQRLGGQR